MGGRWLLCKKAGEYVTIEWRFVQMHRCVYQTFIDRAGAVLVENFIQRGLGFVDDRLDAVSVWRVVRGTKACEAVYTHSV